MPYRRMGLFLVPLVALTLVLAACGETGQEKLPGTQNYSATNASGETMIDHLDFGAFGGGSNPQINYNPFSPNVLSSGYTFEPLMVMDNYSCELHPWLATASNWQDPQTLQFTIRDGVKWNDGQPFSADDVVFTFNLTKKVPAFDSTGVWQALDSVSNQGNIVTFKFKEPASQMLSKVAAQLIVPQHIWGSVADPVKFTNDAAVGTGPYKPTFFNGRLLILGINQGYWQADKLRVNQLVFHRTEGGSSVDQLNLAQGKYDTNAMFIPNIQSVYVDKNPDQNHYWFPAGGAISLGFNLTKAPFNDVEFRKGMAFAIDRDAIATKAEYGYVKTASQTGLVLPGQKDWLDPSIQNQGNIGYDPKQATATLEKAGYKKNPSGQLTGKDGQAIEINFEVQNGYTDWIQAAQIIQQDLRAIGITVNVTTPASENVESDRANGRFDLVYDVHGGSCSMYDNYFLPLDSKQSAEVGKPAASNFIRWQDPTTDKLIDQLRSATSEEDQKPIVYQLQKIMMDQLPTIPLWYGGVWFQYTTNRATGWPSADNPYAKPGDGLLIITSLKPGPDYKPPQ